jgi:hypothetical protein
LAARRLSQRKPLPAFARNRRESKRRINRPPHRIAPFEGEFELKRLVSFVFLFAFAYFARRTLIPILFNGGGAPAAAAEAGASAAPAQPSWIVVKFAGLFQHLTGAALTSREMSALSLGLMLYCILFGRISRLVLGSHGFGALLNGLIGLAGAGAALSAFGLVAPAGMADSAARIQAALERQR